MFYLWFYIISGERGVHSLTGNTIQLIEGDILSLDFILFFPSTVSNIRFFHNGTTSSANIAQDDRCVTPALGGDVPGIRSLQISSVTISDSGSYTLRANNGTYESTITVTVLKGKIMLAIVFNFPITHSFINFLGGKDNSSVPEQSSIVVTSPSMSFVASTSIITTTGSSSSNIATTRSSNSSSNDVSTTIGEFDAQVSSLISIPWFPLIVMLWVEFNLYHVFVSPFL